MFKIISSWRQDSQRELLYRRISSYHRLSNFNEGINDLFKEVSDLCEKLSVTEKECNGLIEDAGAGDLQERFSVITNEKNELLQRVDDLR